MANEDERKKVYSHEYGKEEYTLGKEKVHETKLYIPSVP